MQFTHPNHIIFLSIFVAGLSLFVFSCACVCAQLVLSVGEFYEIITMRNKSKTHQKPVKTHKCTIFTCFHLVHLVPLRFRPPLFHSSLVYMFPQLAQRQPTTKDISMVFWLWQKCEKMSDTRAGYLLGAHRSVAHPPSREILSFSVCSTS